MQCSMTSKVNGKMGILTPLDVKPWKFFLQKLDISNHTFSDNDVPFVGQKI